MTANFHARIHVYSVLNKDNTDLAFNVKELIAGVFGDVMDPSSEILASSL